MWVLEVARVVAMHITEINVLDVPPLEGIDINCHERVNLFIGSNASGKSTILRAVKGLHSLALNEQISYVFDNEQSGNISSDENGNSFIVNIFEMGPSDDWPRGAGGSWETLWDAVPFVYIPATRINLPGVSHYFQDVDKSDGISSDSPMQDLFDTEGGIFDGRYVELAIDWLREGMTGNQLAQYELRRAYQLGYSCATRICPEILSEFGPYSYVDEWGISATPRNLVHFGMGIRTNDHLPDGISFYAGELSSGTQGTLLWIYALVIKMANHYGWKEGWEENPAILLIDEIENHLHPTWQRRVIPALLEHFPGLQIFATTHSPFVVAGLKAGQVHLLKRDENGAVTATTNTEDIVGWTADEILRNMMGVDEPTDQLTVDRANRLRQLREKERLTDEEESELNELRRQVNEDLLSKGGPLEAQRERYGELMEQFLRSRQSELSQDGD